jgi:hypothetical protein
MKVAIVGSRDFDDDLYGDMIHSLVYRMDKEDYVVSGGASGADSIAERAAQMYNVGRIIHAAHWEKHGKAAGPIRNALIVRDADVVFAFCADAKTSRGTTNCILQAQKAGKPVYRYDAKTNTWLTPSLTEHQDGMDYVSVLGGIRSLVENRVIESTAQRDEGG